MFFGRVEPVFPGGMAEVMSRPDEGPQRKVKVKDHRRILFRKHLRFHGIRHHRRQVFFYLTERIGTEKCIEQWQRNSSGTSCPERGIKIRFFLFHTIMFSGTSTMAAVRYPIPETDIVVAALGFLPDNC
jgi:hypothetical protein